MEVFRFFVYSRLVDVEDANLNMALEVFEVVDRFVIGGGRYV